jgi:hypothetical protein
MMVVERCLINETQTGSLIIKLQLKELVFTKGKWK